MVTGFYAGILGLWLAFLLLRVVGLRRKYRVGLGDGGQNELTRAVRIHGNFTETVPFVLILMAAMEMNAVAPLWVVHGFGVALVLSRILHWHGVSRSAGTTFGRVAGTATVVGLLIVGAVILIVGFAAG